MTRKTKRILNIVLALIVGSFGTYFVLGKANETSPAISENEAYKNQLMVEIVDCGQGDSILAKTPEGDTILVDTGDADEREKVLSALKKQNVQDIDLLVSTHPHADHYGSMQYILEHFTVHQILLTDAPQPDDAYQDILNTADRLKVTKTYSKAGNTLQFHKLQIDILGPVKEYDDLNNMSIVLRLSYGANSFLLAGDAEKESEKDILKNNPSLGSDVLKAGHHGSDTSTSKNFLKAASPVYAAISVGKDNSYNHPAQEILELFNKNKIQIYRTDEDGDIYFYSDGSALTVNVPKLSNTLKKAA